MNTFSNRARSVLSTLILVCAGAALSACGGGGDGGQTVAPATSTPIAPTNPGSSNNAPTISGTALTTATVSTPYSFAPSASDADGDQLTFQIQNKPAWATFNTTTGALTGTPSATGNHTNIIISASDGKASASLAAFTIAVSTAPATGTGAATLSWAAPTQNVDGTQLNNLAGYVITYGQSSNALSSTIRITNPSIDRYVFDDLTKGATYYFAVRAVNAAGIESTPSAVVSKTI
jgi:hypothetical protein